MAHARRAGIPPEGVNLTLKSFYQSLGWRLDADIVVGDAFRVVQLTPTHSACSIAFGKGVTTGEPGSVKRLILAIAFLAAMEFS